MRESNFMSTGSNRASLAITQTLYDRRALDCTSDRPLVNSLQQLVYLTSSSGRVRETLCNDGGIERIVAMMKECTRDSAANAECVDECAATPFGNPTSLVHFKWHLCMQCLVNLGARGSEQVRRRIVEAGAIPIIATVLHNYLELHAPIDARACPAATAATAAAAASAAHSTASLTASVTPLPPTGTTRQHQMSESDWVVFDDPSPQSGQQVQSGQSGQLLQPPQSGAQASAATPTASAASLQRIAAQRQSTDATLGDMIADGAEDSDASNTISQSVRTLRNESEQSEQSELAMRVASDRFERFISQFSLATGQATAGTATEITSAGSTNAMANSINRDQRPMDPAVSGIDWLMLPTVPPASLGSRNFENILLPREQDVSWALEILAFVSKYSSLKREIQQTRLVPRMTVSGQEQANNKQRRECARDQRREDRRQDREDRRQDRETRRQEREDRRYERHHTRAVRGHYSEHDRGQFAITSGEDLFYDEHEHHHDHQHHHHEHGHHHHEHDHDHDDEDAHMDVDSDSVDELVVVEQSSEPDEDSVDFVKMYHEYDFLNTKDVGEEYCGQQFNLFQLVERFTTQRAPREFPHWAGIIMRNSCRKDETRAGVRQCANFACGKWEDYPRQFPKCRRCKRPKYCSKRCQLDAWVLHRYWCVSATSSSSSATTQASNTSAAPGVPAPAVSAASVMAPLGAQPNQPQVQTGTQQGAPAPSQGTAALNAAQPVNATPSIASAAQTAAPTPVAGAPQAAQLNQFGQFSIQQPSRAIMAYTALTGPPSPHAQPPFAQLPIAPHPQQGHFATAAAVAAVAAAGRQQSVRQFDSHDDLMADAANEQS